MEVTKIIVGAFYYVNEHRAVLAKALAWPFAAILLIDATEYLETEGVLDYLIGFIDIGVQTIFAITTHRVVLLGPDSVSKWGISSWTKRETFFVLYIIGLSFLVIPPLMLLGFIPILGNALIVLIIFWLVGRLSLVFPGIAVDKGVTFKLSWELTKGYQLLMFLVVLVFPIFLGAPIFILNMLSDTFFLTSVASAFVIVFEVAALSMAYQLIIADKYNRKSIDQSN